MSTPEETNMRIAELCGWTDVRLERRVFISSSGDNRPLIVGTSPQGYKNHSPLNYSGSLDAMHEAEKTLTKDERHQYYLEACRIINETNRETPHWAGASPFHYMTMTAAQRAAAFLTTKTRTN